MTTTLPQADDKQPDIPNLFHKAEAFEMDGELEKAVSTYKQILDSHPDHEQTLWALFELYRDMGNNAEALKTITTLSNGSDINARLKQTELLIE